MTKKKRPRAKFKKSTTNGWEKACYYAFHLLAFLLPLTLSPFSYDNFDLPKVVLFRALVVFIFACWLAGQVFSKNIIIRRSSLDVFVLVFLGVIFIATIHTIHFPTSLWGKYERYEGFLALLTYGTLFFLTVQTFKDTKRIKTLSETIIAATALVSLYGLFQYFGFDFISWGEQFFEAKRVASTFGNPILLAGYLVMVFPIVIIRYQQEKNIYRVTYYALVSFLVFAALLVTFSRGGWIAFLVSVVFLIATQGRRLVSSRLLALALSLFAILLIVALVGSANFSAQPNNPSLFERAKLAFKIGEGSVATRLLIWGSALKIIRDSPWLGYGPDTFHLTYPPRGSLRYAQLVGRWNQPDNAHNYLLQLGSTAGLLGIWSFLSIIIFLTWRGSISLLREKSENKLLFAGLLTGIIAYLIHLQFSINVIDSGVTFWLLLGLFYARNSQEITVNKEAFIILALGVLLTVLFISGMTLRFLLADIHFLKAEENASFGFLDLAAQEYRRAIELNPYQNLYLVSLGRYYTDLSLRERNKEFFFQAENIYLEGQRRSPQELDNYVFLGDLYLRSGDRETKYFSLAEEQFKRALVISPYWADTHTELGLVYLKTGRFKLASQEFSRSIKIDSWEMRTYLYLGRSLEKQGEVLKAAQAYRSALERDPNNQEAREALRRLEGKQF